MSGEDTPMMRQYSAIKEKHRDAVLFFRMGDFYEMFKSDAEDVSRLLNLNLTKRHGVPMCGIPYHAAQNYIGRLLKAGRKIAICEQISLPKKGIAQRDVVEIITPGTVVDESFLDKKTPNYLVAFGQVGPVMALAYAELSTGDFLCAGYEGEHREEFIRKELSRLGSPREILIQESLLEFPYFRGLLDKGQAVLNPIADWLFDPEAAYKQLTGQFQLVNLKGLGFKEGDPVLAAAGVLLDYIRDSARHCLEHLKGLRRYSQDHYVAMDDATQKNLELIRNMEEGSRSFTLLSVIDETLTAMGGRKICHWVLNPLRRKETIEERLFFLTKLYRNQSALGELRDVLGRILDVERLSSRIGLDKAHGKDMISLRNSLRAVFVLQEIIERPGDLPVFCSPELLGELKDIVKLLEDSLLEEPSILLTEGKLIKAGYHQELDELRSLRDNSKAILDKYLESIKVQTGLSNLKLKYNKIIGYFLEVSKTQSHLVPQDFIRRQSLVGAERYSTAELSELESRINEAFEKIVDLERALFIALREELKPKIPLLQELCDRIARLDCFASLAYVATIRGYSCPLIREEGDLKIKGGRHPVVEAYLPQGEFVPNDLALEKGRSFFALITGPNMAGKSTYLRQSALITLMAHMGSYIPAEHGEIPLVDRIFCRVGASDNLARGESTFLVEMNETAHILRNASEESLIIMDEVGRGTSTNDGLAIAWSIVEHILQTIRAKTLFATHYHELTELKDQNLINLSMAVEETGQEVFFLKKIQEGAVSNSYGIHVASLAGLPSEVVRRATLLLGALEKTEKGFYVPPVPQKIHQQQDLFDPSEIVLDQLRALNISQLTPLDALNKLNALQESLKKI